MSFSILYLVFCRVPFCPSPQPGFPKWPSISRIQVTISCLSRRRLPRKIWTLHWLGHSVPKKNSICWLAYALFCGKEGGIMQVILEHSDPTAVIRHGVSFPESKCYLGEGWASPEGIPWKGHGLSGHKKYLQKVSNIELSLSKAENVFSILSFHNLHNERHFVSTQSIFDDWLNELKPSGYRK